MIKINLLAQKRPKHADKNTQQLALGFLVLFLCAAGVYFLVHAPLVADVESAQAAVNRTRVSIRKLTDETKDFDVVAQQIQAAEEQAKAIASLNAARVTPAWALRELANVLTRDHKPTMTPDMAQRVRTDHNRAWSAGWDPKRLWIDSFQEKGGVFTLKGGAQSDSDITQLALRLQASVFFSDVVPEGGQPEKMQGLSVYKFTITGKVAY